MPPLLQELPDAPVVLYVQGAFTAADQLSIGIVGTRHASAYGRTAAELFGRGLARAGLTIVSGLARGIDTAAHEAALEVGGRTIAFLGSSLTDIYPAENTELAARIAKQGAVASETPPFAKTKPGVFPQRNRLISGMSLGVLIVEAAERSGALITASHAGEQGRDVFAVPGSIQSRTSRGCNKLIRDGAILVQDASDVIEHLGPLFQDTKLQDDRTIRHPGEMLLNDMETCVLQSIQVEPTDIDEITAKSGYNISQVLATISVLHMRKLIRRLSARTVQRI
jgi:DNA processing protein